MMRSPISKLAKGKKNNSVVKETDQGAKNVGLSNLHFLGLSNYPYFDI